MGVLMQDEVEISSGGEGAAGAGEHDSSDVVSKRDVGEQVVERAVQLLVDRVQPVTTVQGDLKDKALPPEPNPLVHLGNVRSGHGRLTAPMSSVSRLVRSGATSGNAILPAHRGRPLPG